MKKKLSLGLFITALSLPSISFGHDDPSGICSFVDPATEEQGLGPDEFSLVGGGITKEEFESAIDEHKKKYDESGIVKSFNANLTIAKLWDNKTKNANASKFGSRWHINMYGGLARDKNFTKDGFALVLCHEMGHLLAGFPGHNKGRRKGLLGNEGNSDYYATFVCANFLWADQDELNAKSRETAVEEVKSFCDKVYAEDEKQQNLCYRKVSASEGLAKFLNKGKAVSFSKPDKKKVSKTNKKHPKGQCRLDTYMAGAACKKYKDWNHKAYPANKKELTAQSCMDTYPDDANAVKEAGFRPRCWFKP